MSGNLLFDEEFDSFDAYSQSDAWKTAYSWGPGTVINGEKAYYVDTENAGTTGPAGATNPFRASNGVLTITTAPTAQSLPTGQPYTSGALTTQGSFAHQYGYYEIRAALSGGKGFWPAFWLMPSDKISPPELDIMEFSSRLPFEYVTTAHSQAGGTYQMSQKFTYGLPDLSSGFHTYAVDWQVDKITWYFDDRAVYSIATPADFHKPMYMLINQAAGGSGGGWIGDPDGSIQTYKIDHVRVYDSKPNGGAAPFPLAPPSTTGSTTGTAGGDLLRGGPGDDRIDGGGGCDTVLITGTRAQYSLSMTGGVCVVADTVAGRDGTDTLSNVERLRFADGMLVLDTVSDAAAQAFRLYRAALGRAPDEVGLGYQTNRLDHGTALENVASGFIASPEFLARYGAPSDAAYVGQLYWQTLGRGAAAVEIDYHVARLERGASRQAVLIGFSESPENIAAVAPLTANGIWFT